MVKYGKYLCHLNISPVKGVQRKDLEANLADSRTALHQKNYQECVLFQVKLGQSLVLCILALDCIPLALFFHLPGSLAGWTLIPVQQVP